MIKVDRKSVSPPLILGSEEAREGIAQRREFFSTDRKNRKQKRYNEDFEHHVLGDPELIEKLLELFHHKCAFCETKIKDLLDIEYYRPIIEAIGDPEPLPDGYWWLNFDWFNMYSVCPDCSRSKSVYFPLSEGAKRGRPVQKEKALRREKPLLIDPCFDEPRDYLTFDHNTAEVLPTELNQTRADATIEILGLNRPGLVEDRLKALREMENLLNEAEGYIGNGPIDDAFQLIDHYQESQHEFSGLRRSMMREWLELNDLESAWVSRFGTEPLGLSKTPSEAEMEATFQTMELEATKKEEKKNQSEELGDGIKRSRLTTVINRTATIERIEITNFKCIENLTILQALADPSEPETEFPLSLWTVLLGENGSGKSSILQSVGIALIDHNEFLRLVEIGEIEVNNLLRFGQDFGVVKVFLTHSPDPIGFTLARQKDGTVSIFFLCKVVVEGPVVRGFGAVRITTASTDQRAKAFSDARVQVGNIFDPFRTLRDPEEFISGLNDEEWQPTRLALGDLIALNEEQVLDRDNNGVYLESNGVRNNYRDLSDGYRTILAMACDIIAGASKEFSDFKNAPGIILLDELGNHLHPRWKMRIVRALRRTFSSMQFIITTHEPLCLRGVRKGETFLIAREENEGIVAISEDLPSPRSLRVDQLLTSEHFGLSSTIDPDLDALFQEYYFLRAQPTRDEKQEERMRKLKSMLDAEGVFKPVLGYTRRDQLIYEILDDQLAKELTSASRSERKEIRSKTKTLVAELWNNIITDQANDQS